MGQSYYKYIVQVLKALCVPYKDPCTNEIVNPFPDGAGTFECSQLSGCGDEICELVKRDCSDSIIDNGCGSFTHIAVDETSTTITHTPSSITPVDTGMPRQDISNHIDGCANTSPIQESITSSSISGNTLTIIHEDTSETVYTPVEKSIISSDNTIVITDNGLVCDLSSPKSIFTDLNPNGQTIGNHNDGTGVIVNVNETVTNSVATNTSLTITHEDNSTTVFTPDNTQNTVTSVDGSVTIVPSPNTAGEINYDLSVDQKEITSTGGTVIITDNGDTCNLEVVHTVNTNTQSSTTSNNNSVTIVETTNSEGEINYDLSVPTFDATEIECKLALLCNATITVTDCQQIPSFNTPTSVFTVTDPDFLEVCSVSFNGGGLDLNTNDTGGYTVSGNVITTQDPWGSPTNPCIGYIFYKKQVKLIDCTSC